MRDKSYYLFQLLNRVLRYFKSSSIYSFNGVTIDSIMSRLIPDLLHTGVSKSYTVLSLDVSKYSVCLFCTFDFNNNKSFSKSFMLLVSSLDKFLFDF